MRNTKEIKTILSVLYLINCLGDNDPKLSDVLDYAFDRIFNENTRFLLANCLGKTKEDMYPVIEQWLREDTQYHSYMERMAALRKANNNGGK